jgi:hypothetical protein
MKSFQIAICTTIFAVLIIGGVSIGDTPFTPDGQKWEPAPEGHIIGKDNGEISGSLGMIGEHFQGEDCGICHSPGKKAGNYVFTVSGTIFKDKLGIDVLPGAEVILKDVEDNVISMTTNEAGNFFTYAPVAYDPAVGSDPDTPRNWRYKAWVKYGNSERPMVTLAYVGATANFIPRMSCNMHHGRLGTRGAASAGEFDTLESFPAESISFKRHVMPILKNRCKACHMPESARPYTTYGTEIYNYSGGLDLSSYTKEADSEKGILDTVDLSEPVESTLLVKPLTGSTHAGGGFWNLGDPEYEAINQWIVEGASNN